MDSIISTALEEICSHGEAGVTLTTLWSSLNPSLSASNLDLSSGLKQALWTGLLSVPSLQFHAHSATYSSSDPSIQTFEAAETINLKLVAQENLRDNFLGLYNVHSSNASISLPQRRTLQRLAVARKNGITQNQLAKEFGIKGKNLFYVLRSLECQGLIVRQSAVVKTKEACDEGEARSIPSVTTNLVYLSRYAKHLGSQQKFEIIKEEPSTESFDNVKGRAVRRDDVEGREDVVVKDYLPAMKAVCNKLEKATGKVLVVSDIKKEFGYIGATTGHREWRKICSRLIDGHIVEEFDAKVNGKVCRRLGIDNKKNHDRLVSMFSRFGMDLQAENHKKCIVYRVWSPGRRNLQSSNAFPSEPNLSNMVNDNRLSNVDIVNLDTPDRSTEKYSEYGPLVLTGCISSPEKVRSTDVSRGSPQDATESNLLCNNSQEILTESKDTFSNTGLDLVSTEMETSLASSETSIALKPLDSESNRRYPCLLTVENARREKIILERLQNEKFIIIGELRKWIRSLEKDKCTTTDPKTIDRLLNKLQQEGHCKCIKINVPVITNCGSSRITQVVLHPDVQSLSPELVSKIHDQLRSFEIQSRGQCSSRLKNSGSVPVLNDVQRTQNLASSGTRATRSEAMRANGFILAKMIRAKLLHCFLWDHLYGSQGSNDVLLSEKNAYQLHNPYSCSKLFSLEATTKAIPIELFLQVVGSTQNFENMIEKCRRGLCLSDLSTQEYKSLMDSRSTERLSSVIDILRRLKLIRLLSEEHPEDGSQVLQATLIHALELKPYIEEPISKDMITLSFRPFDLRPRIRHDFVLSNRKAVDEYWKTLEYCYAAADPRAALHAFPGSAVNEVFHFRSWASVRVMSADQRAELLKRVMKDDQSGKLSFKDCGRIAKDLNLSLEQVLRVYYDRRQLRLNQIPVERSNGRSVKVRKVDKVAGEFDDERLLTCPDTGNQFMEGENSVSSTGAHEMFLDDENHINTGDPELNEDDEGSYSVITRSTISKMKASRQKRFSWTEEADRQLVIQYARHRAALGTKYYRTDWGSVVDLPAPPSTCRKRMASLNSNVKIRKAVMRLCNMLSERYVKLLEKTQNKLLEKDECRSQGSSGKGLNKKLSDANEHAKEEEGWDDFNNNSIKTALDEVLRCKWMAKLEASKRVGSTYEEWSDIKMNAKKNDFLESEKTDATTPEDVQNFGGGLQKSSMRRSRAQRLHKKFIELLNEEVKVSRHVYKSLAISNAVELFKLIFLSTSSAPMVPNMLAEILRRYSERDLFAAFNYLREKRVMVGGSGNQPFSLSQQFMHNVFKSSFPTNSGTRASKFANWLHEREKDLTEGGIDLTSDLQCGDIFHLFALISSGQLLLSPCLPDEGVGEAEDTRSLKRKIDNNDFSDGDKAKKLKFLVAAEGEIISRREKGFPGIMVSISRAEFSTADVVDLFRAQDTCSVEPHIDENNICVTTSAPTSLFYSDHVKEILNSESNTSVIENMNESPWIAMAGYAASLFPVHADLGSSSSINPDLFKAVYAAIRKAGDQGLSMDEISEFITMPGEKMPEVIISVLETFGRVMKVSAFDSVHVVDALYRSKYFLTSTAVKCQDIKARSAVKSVKGDNNHVVLNADSHDSLESIMNTDDIHKVSILNFPVEMTDSINENQVSDLHEVCIQGKLVSSEGDKEVKSSIISSGELCVPILPWINGDGTINEAVYKGLRRRVIGIAMQNPGILEDEIINRMDVLNPQSCRKLLELMILDKHLNVRKMHQTTSSAPPTILGTLFRSSFSKPKLVCRNHYFANPMSTFLL
ncbi:uncharacterized protein LOC133794533 isoform X2 [Humulus lupulus]|uniref:uncharacterized protein LOC133794533 isoform X2 n=1 Tax=Humulus lupulus TaxID=3486 RepID=UPI002B4114C9|nr:uncharacterized protein LOC133794533 isoform X2 [Humulus lupulus]